MGRPKQLHPSPKWTVRPTLELCDAVDSFCQSTGIARNQAILNALGQIYAKTTKEEKHNGY